MLIYLDMCCLKRPFDDQSQPRIRLESEAVLSLLAIESDDVQFVRSPSHRLVNSQNPVKERASRVAQWLMAKPLQAPDAKSLEDRTAELMKAGFKSFDALHVASAEHAKANVFASVDDRLLKVARRKMRQLRVRVMGVVELAQEVVK